jgi:uncharacterized protein
MLGLNDRVPLRAPAVAPVPPATPAPARDGKPAAPAPGQAAQPPQQTQAAKPAAAGETEQKPDYESSAERTEVAEAQHPTPGGTFDFHTDDWAKLYAKRIDEMIAVLKSKGVPVIWVGLPALRGPKATADMSYLDDLYRTEADKAGIIYIDIWDGFVDENGRYSVEGPDFEGQIRRLRTADGVHFTKYGALKLAHLVDQELGRILANPVATAVPAAPETAAPAKPGAVRPAIGPVLPLTTAGGAPGAPLNSETGGLLGGGSHAAPIASEDPTAEKVLVHGDALSPPVGRADNFSWPPGEQAAAATPAAAQGKPAPAAMQAAPAPSAATAQPQTR